MLGPVAVLWLLSTRGAGGQKWDEQRGGKDGMKGEGVIRGSVCQEKKGIEIEVIQIRAFMQSKADFKPDGLSWRDLKASPQN